MERVKRGVSRVLEARVEAFHSCAEKKELHPYCWRGSPRAIVQGLAKCSNRVDVPANAFMKNPRQRICFDEER